MAVGSGFGDEGVKWLKAHALVHGLDHARRAVAVAVKNGDMVDGPVTMRLCALCDSITGIIDHENQIALMQQGVLFANELLKCDNLLRPDIYGAKQGNQ